MDLSTLRTLRTCAQIGKLSDDSCSDGNMFPEDSAMTSRILSGYVFPYLNDKIIEDHGEDLTPKIAESISPEISDIGEYSSGYAHLHRLAPL
ncbi:RNA polymerase beta' subunit [Dorcoceras hygrometricum]|uniref:RNA polymerase beta' subunit n=1 Tax=Dorcoceras hygrometricum TaxID=472368 RepID=A0A2Z7D8R1_9LAMI|nr:RNA polymerase beta' subunit [Dorcoceras hygrometricum]